VQDLLVLIPMLPHRRRGTGALPRLSLRAQGLEVAGTAWKVRLAFVGHGAWEHGRSAELLVYLIPPHGQEHASMDALYHTQTHTDIQVHTGTDL